MQGESASTRRTYVVPFVLDDILEEDTAGETNRAILRGIEDEGEESGEEGGLLAEGVQVLLCLLSRIWIEGCKEQLGELYGHVESGGAVVVVVSRGTTSATKETSCPPQELLECVSRVPTRPAT